ncbi:MAG: disulfide bond formation protein B [Pontibacterium sp.]
MSIISDHSFNKYRQLNMSGLLISSLGLLLSIFVVPQPANGLDCYLCSFVSVVLMGTTSIFLLAVLHAPSAFGQRVYATAASLLTLLAITACLRHIWMMTNEPHLMLSCDLTRIDVFGTLVSPQQFLSLFIDATQCKAISWTFAGLSFAELALCFLGLILYVLIRILRQKPPRKHIFK